MRRVFYGMAGTFFHNGLYLCLASPVSFSSSSEVLLALTTEGTACQRWGHLATHASSAADPLPPQHVPL